jgi:lysophospholipid acyltransferase (LPLAT)-like uncharacterized protein
LDWLGRLLASYFKLCRATSKIAILGREDFVDDLRTGPVLLVVWHGRLPSALLSWSSDFGECITLSDPSPIGRVGAAAQRRFGMTPILMRSKAAKPSTLRDVMRAVRDGKSLAMAADGSRGPNRKVTASTAAWIIKTGRPVHMVSWSLDRALFLSTWDRFLFPLPFSHGAILYRRFEHTAHEVEPEALRESLKLALDRLESEADARAGRRIEPS